MINLIALCRKKLTPTLKPVRAEVTLKDRMSSVDFIGEEPQGERILFRVIVVACEVAEHSSFHKNVIGIPTYSFHLPVRKETGIRENLVVKAREVAERRDAIYALEPFLQLLGEDTSALPRHKCRWGLRGKADLSQHFLHWVETR